MHTLSPNTSYKMVEVTLACPAEFSDAEIADGLNEMFNESLQRFPDNSAFCDWKIEFDVPEQKTSSDPVEGELFTPVRKTA